jgi:hypothetical protein
VPLNYRLEVTDAAINLGFSSLMEEEARPGLEADA